MEKKKIEAFVIGTFLIVSVLAIAVADAQQIVPEGTPNVEGSFNLKNWFKHTFNIQTYSVVGDYRQCARTPGVTLEIEYNRGIPSGRNYYSNSLIDVFDSNWNTLGEYRDYPPSLCKDEDGCIIEYYECPHPECSSDSQCADWYGNEYECTEFQADDPNILYQEGSNFNACVSSGQDKITCYYYPGEGSSCLQRTYMGDTECPSTYMGMTLYSSKSDCDRDVEDIISNVGTSTTIGSAKKISLTKDIISDSTSADLLASSCLSSSECILPSGDEEDFSAKCISIAKLRDEGVLTETDANNFFNNAKMITYGIAGGVGAGITACIVTSATITVATGGTALPITAPLITGCALAGGALGGIGASILLSTPADDNLLKELKAENANAVGICVKDPKSNLETYTGWAAFFDITGDRGVDGLIIIVGILILLGAAFKK